MDGHRLGDAGHADVRQCVPLSLCAVVVDVGEGCALSECLVAYILHRTRDVEGCEGVATAECSVADGLNAICQVHLFQIDAEHECACTDFLQYRSGGEALDGVVVHECLLADCGNGVCQTGILYRVRNDEVNLLIGLCQLVANLYLWLVSVKSLIVDAADSVFVSNGECL